MKNFIWILILLLFGAAGYWGWQQTSSTDSSDDLKVKSNIVIKKSSSSQVKEIDEEVVSISDENYELKLLELFPAEGFVGKDLYRRLDFFQKWLDSLKIYIVYGLGLEARIYAEYVEYRFKFTQTRLRAREKIKKRHGNFEDFSDAYARVRVDINREYLDKLEDLFGNKFDDLVKFNHKFNDKIKSVGINRYSDGYITVDI